MISCFFTFDDCLIYHILDCCKDRLDFQKICRPELINMEGDEKITELFTTMDLYLRNGRSVKKTAEALYLHSNTVRYRIDRLAAMLNADLNDGQDVFNIQLGMHISRFLEMEQKRLTELENEP